jgi:voltage-gated potassium channel
MNKFFYLLVASGVVIFVGTVVMYNIESGAENTRMKTLLDALWWCVATVSTVGYGDVVPVTNLGRIVALIYMFFGITLIAILMAVVTNTFYKKRIEKPEIEKKEREMSYLKDIIIKKLSEIETKQAEYTETVNLIRSWIENKGRHDAVP